MKKTFLVLMLLLLVSNALAQAPPPPPPSPLPKIINLPGGYDGVGEWRGEVRQPCDSTGKPLNPIYVRGGFHDPTQKGFSWILCGLNGKVEPEKPWWKWPINSDYIGYGYSRICFVQGFGKSTASIPGPATNTFRIEGITIVEKPKNGYLQTDPQVASIRFGQDPNNRTTVEDQGCYLLTLQYQINRNWTVGLQEMIDYLHSRPAGFFGWETNPYEVAAYCELTGRKMRVVKSGISINEALNHDYAPSVKIKQKYNHWVNIIGWIVEDGVWNYWINDPMDKGVSLSVYEGGASLSRITIYPYFKEDGVIVVEPPKKEDPKKQQFLNKIQENSTQEYPTPVEKDWGDSGIIVITEEEPIGMQMKLIKQDSAISEKAEPTYYYNKQGVAIRRERPRLMLANAPAGNYELEISTWLKACNYKVTVLEYDHERNLIETVYKGRMNAYKITIPFYHQAEAVKTRLEGTVDLQDYSGDKTGIIGTVTISDGFESGTYSMVLDENGAFVIETDKKQDCTVTVKCMNWLSTSRLVNIPEMGTLETQQFSLKNGDVTDNNEVDFSDINAVRAAYGSMPGDNNWNERADVDGNGEVDFTDINIVRSKYGECGD